MRPRFDVVSLAQGGTRQTSMLILHEGQLVHERYARGRGADDLHVAYSVTKSIVSALIGIAVRDGYLCTEQPVASFFPESRITHDPAITIEHLLRMTAGYPGMWAEGSMDFLGADCSAAAAFETPLVQQPGEGFIYCGGPGMQVLVAVIERATGRNLYDFARAELFDPLGVGEIEWRTTADGSPIGGWGIYMTPRDMLRIGYLYLNDGIWDGRQILPEGWVTQSRPARNWTMSYGYLWWGMLWSPVFGSGYEARGMRGQFITIYPRRNMVVVRTGNQLRA